MHGFDALERGNAALAMAAAMSLGALAYGPIERWLGDPKLTTLIGSALTGLPTSPSAFSATASAASPSRSLAAIGAFGLSYGILMAHARLFFPAALIGRGVTFLNFAFIGGAGVVQWLSGRFVQAARGRRAAGPRFGLLHLGFGAALLAPARSTPSRPRGPPRLGAGPRRPSWHGSEGDGR